MSAILSADDLNDFISPGFACIKPVETLPPTTQTESRLEHEVILDGQAQARAAPAQITLTDCLACSGCVTSAEAVLVSLQSHSEVLNTLDVAPALRLNELDTILPSVEGLENQDSKIFVASVSPQVRANLAAACGNGTSGHEAGLLLERLFMGEDGIRAGGKWGNAFTWVVDTNTAREACLVLGSEEVRRGDLASSKTVAAPVLTSSCPGWVCYAEKTHPYVLPHLSRVKSPQALMGTLLKTTLSRKLGISPDRIWHLAVMPCFDKKLEASREELTDTAWGGDGQDGRGVRDVDCVITSKEVIMLAESRGFDFFALSKTAAPPQPPPFPDRIIHRFLFPPKSRKNSRAAGTSGGYLQFVLHDIQSQYPNSRIQTVRGRNTDVIEYAIHDASGQTVFRAARYYGFRNIQNLVRKLKPAKPSRMLGGKPFGSARNQSLKAASLDYAYIEVMACPGGCTNGGGQIKVDDAFIFDRKGFPGKASPQAQKAWLADVDEAYFSAEEPDHEQCLDKVKSGSTVPDDASLLQVRDVLLHWSRITSIDLEKLVYTDYREVVSIMGQGQPTGAEKVVQLAGKIGGGW